MYNFYKSLILVFLLVSISSCGNEDICTVDDWTGTYSTEINCNLTGMVIGMDIDTSIVLPLEELTIIKIDDQTVIFDDGGIENPEILVTGCEILIDTTLASSNAMIFGEAIYILDGNQIRGMAEIDAAAFTGIQGADLNFTCNLNYTRK